MASDALPVYSAEDTIGGIQGLLSESLEEWAGSQARNSAETVANDHLQQSRQQALRLPITQYPTSLLSAAAVFHRSDEQQQSSATTDRNTFQPTTNISITQRTVPINREEEIAAQQIECERDIFQAEIILSFHDAVRAKNIEVVTHLVNSGVCSPDVTDDIGTTPLIAAVEAGDVNMVRCLLQLGAEIDTLAAYDEHASSLPTTTITPNPNHSHALNSNQARRQNRAQRHYTRRTLPLRTPLMVASQLGNLVIVRLLLSPTDTSSTLSANDAIISPTDGQIALRLAALHGHKEIVRILPSRRGGGLLRWKHAHATSLSNIKRAGKNVLMAFYFVLYEIPRFFIWSCPKHLLVLPLWEGGKWCWKHRSRFRGWCKRQISKIPGRCIQGCKAVGRGVKKVGEKVVKLPTYMKRVVVWMWGKVKQIPPALRIGFIWLLNSLKTLGKGALDILSRLLSVIHTTLLAVFDFFRTATARDILNGLTSLLHAIFIAFPKSIYNKVILGGFKTAWEIIKRVFGTAGEIVVWIGVWLVKAVVYVPKQIVGMGLWMGKSLKKGVDEVGVWFDPKRV